MKPMGSLQNNLANGSEIDRIIGVIAFGEGKIQLSSSEELRLQRAELALDLLEQYNGNQRLVIGALMNRNPDYLPRSVAYLACSDAISIFGYISKFDYLFEMLIKKNRLELAISKAETAGKLRDQAMLEKEHTAVVELIRLEQERRKPDGPKTLNIKAHNDYTKLGWTEESMKAAQDKIDNEIIPGVLKKYKEMTNVPTE